MKLRLFCGLALGLGLGLATCTLAGVRVKLEEVPKPAVQAVQGRFPKATIRYADRETNGNFELAIKDGENLLDVGVTPDGKLLNIKQEFAEDMVPKAVKDGLQKQYSGKMVSGTFFFAGRRRPGRPRAPPGHRGLRERLGQAGRRYAVELFACCALPNHWYRRHRPSQPGKLQIVPGRGR